MSTLKTTILLSALACLAMSSAAFAQDNVPVKAPESLKNVPFKIEGVEGFLHSLGIDPKTEIKLSKKELRSLAESNYNDKTAQHFMSVHARHGVGCLSCHDQSEVKGTAWMAYVSNPPMKQDCKTCHTVQADVFKHTDTHSNLDCIACHMPNVASAADYSTDQNAAGPKALRRIHTYKILVDPKASSMVEGEVKVGKDGTAKGYVMAKDEDGNGYVDLMWSCARNAPADWTVFEGKGCHSQYTSKLEEGLVYKDQKQVYGELVKWQNPVKEGYKEIRGATERINKLLEVTRLDRDQRTQVLSYVDLATQIADMIEKDGSWGAHAHNYMTQRLAAAQNYVRKAQEILDAGKFSKTAVDPLK